ncbi:DUF4145 domain-containing protein [Candidatus Pacearchaeota archaeon]|nr:DUF4145 domain-containing protein [Candidatus Pacearchaeota archaeon]
MKYLKPEFEREDFHCPFCGVYTHQIWGDILENASIDGSGWHHMPNFKGALCNKCKEISIWKDGKLIYPDNPNMPPPNEDLQEEIKLDYNEAASIVEKSPRAAAALLRLAIEKLCKKQLKEEGKDLDECIGSLVKNGLPIQIKEALDVVRVIGNESVHPGEINLNDNKDVAYKLFELVNIIAQDRITQPKEVSKLYKSLPQKKLDGIDKRDKK